MTTPTAAQWELVEQVIRAHRITAHPTTEHCVVDEGKLATAVALSAVLALAREADRYKRDAERWNWLRQHVTFYNVDADYPVDAQNVPVLAQVSERIWYHATDDITSTTLDELADAALAQPGERKAEP